MRAHCLSEFSNMGICNHMQNCVAELGSHREELHAKVLCSEQVLGIIYFQMKYFTEQENVLTRVLCLVIRICHASVPLR